MELIVSYSPMSGALTIWNPELAQRESSEVVTVHDKTPDDWSLYLDLLHGEFVSLVCADVWGTPDWSLWLSLYLPDSVVSEIADAVSGWAAQHASVGVARFARYRTTIAI
jgi:hypothetical protein